MQLLKIAFSLIGSKDISRQFKGQKKRKMRLTRRYLEFKDPNKIDFLVCLSHMRKEGKCDTLCFQQSVQASVCLFISFIMGQAPPPRFILEAGSAGS